MLPFENDLYVTRISGKILRDALEHSAASRFKDSDGAFLQVSGLHVVYNPDKPEGNRVESVQVRCADCPVPSYRNLNESSHYNVIVPQFLFGGGDGYVFIDQAINVTTRMRKTFVEAVRQYLHQQDPVYPDVEGRIEFRGFGESKSSGTRSTRSFLRSFAFMLFTLVVNRSFN